jgi:hypothetical protein
LDAFENVVAQLLRAKGLWVQTSVKINLTKADKRAVKNPSMPRPEIDVVGYCGRTNTVFALECKSFLDSYGVNFGELCGEKPDDTYKLFRRDGLREMVLTRLAEQLTRQGMCRPEPKVILGLVAGKVRKNEGNAIKQFFRQRGWVFRGPAWVRREIERLSDVGYENEVMTVVTKLLLR